MLKDFNDIIDIREMGKDIRKDIITLDNSSIVFMPLKIESIRYTNVGINTDLGFSPFVFSDENIYRDRDRLLSVFLKKINEHKIKYIVFDMYLNIADRPCEVSLKKLLLILKTGQKS